MPKRPGSWLLVGHGSVGSSLVWRLRAAGIEPGVHDPAPRIAIPDGLGLASLGGDGRTFDVVVSCVTPSEALAAAAATAVVSRPDTLLLDWNTLLPDVKAALFGRTPASVVDVALLDTLDADAAAPSLAVAGTRAGEAAACLEALGFSVEVVGDQPGDAARLKLARSLFMKTLEALVIEFEAAIGTLPGADVVRHSIERNTGATFAEFARLLLRTDRVHAARRAAELRGAVEVYRELGRPVALAGAAVGTLEDAADAWARPDAPAEDASLAELTRHLGETLDARR